MKAAHPLTRMNVLCDLFGISRQAWYQHKGHEGQKALEHEIVIKMVKAFRVKQPKVGSRKLLIHLQQTLEFNGIKMGQDALFSLLRSCNLLVRRRRRKAITTDSDHPFHKYPNIIK